MKPTARFGRLFFLLSPPALAALAAVPARSDVKVPGTLDTFVERLSSADPSARAEAACALGQRGREAAPAAKALVGLLGDGLRIGPVECGMSPWMRKVLEAKPEQWKQFETSPGREAAKALAEIGGPALDPVLVATAASSPTARANAALSLGEMEELDSRGQGLALARLVDTLRDDHEEVREAAARSLGEIDDPYAVPPLLGALRDPAMKVRSRAAWALGEIEDPRAVEPLMRALWDGEAGVRRQAAWALGELEDRRAVEGLMGALKDKDAGVRRQVAWALGELSDPRAVPLLARALGDADAGVRSQATWALGEIGDKAAVDGLTGALKDADPQVRKQAAWALGEIADPRAAGPLASALKDPSAEVRKQAAWALGEMKD